MNDANQRPTRSPAIPCFIAGATFGGLAVAILLTMALLPMRVQQEQRASDMKWQQMLVDTAHAQYNRRTREFEMIPVTPNTASLIPPLPKK